MGCESCKVVVREALQKLRVVAVKVELGEADIKGTITDQKKKKFDAAINRAGLALLNNKKGILLEKIKAVIIEYVNDSTERPAIKFSAYLTKKLHFGYPYLSAYFSDMQSTTIEKYLISLKTEKIKELILNSDLTLKEIAYNLNYSSVAHLSKQFKRVTGLLPSHFRKLRENRRITIQDL